MKILITGGRGYVASELCNFFLKSPNNQIRLASRESINNTFHKKNVELVKIDWQNQNNLSDICCGMDVVMHAAGMDAENCVKDWVESYQINGIGTAKLANAACKNGIKHFFYYSTAHVYKKKLSGNISEVICPTNLHPYAFSHLIGERALLYASSTSKMNGYVFRLSNTFGVPLYSDSSAWKLLINDLSRQVAKNGEIYLKSNGSQIRNFMPIGEIPLATNHFLSLTENQSKELTGIYNVGGDLTLSVNEIAVLVGQIYRDLKGTLPKIYRPNYESQNNSDFLIYDIKKIMSTGFELSINSIDTIKKIIENQCITKL